MSEADDGQNLFSFPPRACWVERVEENGSRQEVQLLLLLNAQKSGKKLADWNRGRKKDVKVVAEGKKEKRGYLS